MSLKINEQIAALRKEKGVTQGELAGALGVSNQSVSKWESGQCCPDIQLLPDIAQYFEISIDELMGVKTEIKVESDEKTASDLNDTLLHEGMEFLGKHMLISTSVLQRKMGISYTKAKELIAEMQSRGEIVEVRPGFYKRVESEHDFLRTLVASLTAKSREEMLNVALAMHAAYFLKAQEASASIDSAVDAVIGGQWGYSAFSEPDITTVMRGQSVFYSKNTALDFDSERIGNLCLLMRTLSDRKNLAILSSLYELTVPKEDSYASAEEIAEKIQLPQQTVSEALEGELFPFVCTQSERYRIKGEKMALLPILSILCY